VKSLAEAVLASMSEPMREAKQVQELLAIKAANFSKTSEWLSLSEQHLLYMHRHRIHLRKDYQWLVLDPLLHDDGLGWWFFCDTSIHQFVELQT
jgi:hypothetical protein